VRQETVRAENHRCQSQSIARLPAKTKAGTTDRDLNPRISGIRATEKTRATIETDSKTNTLQAENRRRFRYKRGGVVS